MSTLTPVAPSRAYIAPAKRADWATPDDLFAQLDAEFHFQLDAAASAENARCSFYYDEAANGLELPWAPFTTWVNPPYGRGLGVWLAKADEESRTTEERVGATVVMLLPVRTGVRWFQRYVWAYPRPLPYRELRFLPGRLTFKGAPASAGFDSMLVIFRPTDTIERTLSQ